MKVDLTKTLNFTISDVWQRVESMPEDPPDSQVYVMETESCQGFFIVFPVGIEQTMPFDNPQAVIEGIHNTLADDQALIEVHSENTGQSRIIYSIIKTHQEPAEVQYTLTLNAATDKEAFHLQGFFDEVGMTGMRDSVVYEMKRKEGSVSDGLVGWMADPYDKDFHRQYMMNLSEREEYDSMFPEHPLSVARQFVREIHV